MHDISRETIEEAASGDIDAFAHIYRAASGFVYTLAYRVALNKEEAEEITQDVFLKIHRHLRSFQFRSSFKTWLYRIAVNTALNAHKRLRKERMRRADVEDIENVIAAPVSLDDQGAKDLVRGLLERLNPDQRACIMLREIEGLSYEEMARALRVNVNTVRSRLKRARMALVELGRKEHELRESA
jgi:RNA polymerase sigma-70 factor, ECF subfamily